MHKQSGFTFLEILIAMLIVGILSSVVGLQLYSHVKKARLEATLTQIKILKTALQLYQADSGSFPEQIQGLAALAVKPTVGKIPDQYPADGYLDSHIVPRDGWKHEFVYLVPGPDNAPYEIISYGSDGEPGGTGDAADISSVNF
jgi:general secretion pathway protein G